MKNGPSIIIVNFNAGIRLTEAIQSVIADALEIIVIDNASTDNSIALLTEHVNDNKLILIRNKHNLGFAKACNQGAHIARAPFLLFLNPDCRALPGALANLIQACTADYVGMTGPLLLNPDLSEQSGGRRQAPTPWRSFVKAFGLTRFAKKYPKLFLDFNLHNTPLSPLPQQVEAISGACMLVKRAVLEEIGLFDEQYFLHCEDLDLCHRLRDHGWNILFVSQAKIIHFQGTCSRKVPILVEWYKHQGMIKYYQKFFKNCYPKLFMWLVFAAVYFRFSLKAMAYFFAQAKTKAGYTQTPSKS